jgi:hypothetical protein
MTTQNGGDFISPVDDFFTFDNVVALGDSDVGILDPSGDEFSDSSIVGPESPLITSPNVKQGDGGLFPGPGGQPGVDGPVMGAQPRGPGSTVQEWVTVGDGFNAPDSAVPSGSAAAGFGSEIGTPDGESAASAPD